MDKKDCIEKAKEFLTSSTPINGNCGRMCGSFCCKGDENTGMQILPGEYDSETCPSFGVIKNDIFICNGKCDRKKRPYACMIYPLFPAVCEIDGQTVVKAVFDIRAEKLCPLYNSKTVDRHFFTQVRRSAKILIRNEELKQYLIDKTEELTEYIKLKQLLSDF